jgi:DNA-binding beta-propeller fold protein YncE
MVMNKFISALVVFALSCAWGSSGAASKESAVDEPPIFYPPAPNLPRLQYLTRYSSAYDVSAGDSKFRDFVFGGEDKEEQVVQKPYGVAIHEGAIYVVDTRGAGYVVFDVANGKWRSVTGKGDGAMKKPINIAIDDDGTRYITDTEREVVIVFDNKDRFLRTLGAPGQFKPADVAIAGDRLYVSDVEHQMIHVLDKVSGETLFAFGEDGIGEGQLAHPTGLAIGPDGSVYVSEMTNFRIQQFTADGEFVRTFGSVGTGFGQFARPKGIAVDREGRVYVVDSAFQNVQIFDAAANVLMFFGGPSDQRDSFSLPTAVKIDYDNVEYFRQYADPDFEIEYLVLVANQMGLNKVAVFGFGSPKD